MDSNYVNGGGMWLAIALINAGLAEQKNRSRLAWFFISMFIGPVATLLIVVFPPPLETQELSPGVVHLDDSQELALRVGAPRA